MLLFVGVGRADQLPPAPTPAPPTPTAQALHPIVTMASVANPAPPTPNARRGRSAIRASARHQPALSPMIAQALHLIATTASAARRKSLPAGQPAPWQRTLGSRVGQIAPLARQDSLSIIRRGVIRDRAFALIPSPIVQIV